MYIGYPLRRTSCMIASLCRLNPQKKLKIKKRCQRESLRRTAIFRKLSLKSAKSYLRPTTSRLRRFVLKVSSSESNLKRRWMKIWRKRLWRRAEIHRQVAVCFNHKHDEYALNIILVYWYCYVMTFLRWLAQNRLIRCNSQGIVSLKGAPESSKSDIWILWMFASCRFVICNALFITYNT